MLYKEKNYTINLNYLFNNYIREYDISKANISVLYSKGVINEELYNKLYNADRMQRQVYIGISIRENPEIQEILNEGIIEYKQKFFEANNINDNDIVSIKNDAVFILNKIPTVLSFDKVTFVHKNTYTSFMRLNELEVYYGQDVIDIKGIKDSDLEMYHMDFLNIIISYLECIERYGSQSALQYITSVMTSYIRGDLPISVYRRFRSSNDYLMVTGNFLYSAYSVTDSEYNRKMINKDHNLYILRLMHMYASQLLYEEKTK